MEEYFGKQDNVFPDWSTETVNVWRLIGTLNS